MLRLRDDVLLGEPLPELATAVLDGHWLEGREFAHHSGKGSVEVAKQWFLEAWQGEGNQRLLGVYEDGKPVGFCVLEDRGEKTVGLELVIRGSVGTAPTAVARLLDTLFSNGVYRVEAEPLSVARSVVTQAIHFGFWKEGRKRAAKWLDGRPYDAVLLAMIKPRWQKIRRQDWLGRKRKIRARRAKKEK